MCVFFVFVFVGVCGGVCVFVCLFVCLFVCFLLGGVLGRGGGGGWVLLKNYVMQTCVTFCVPHVPRFGIIFPAAQKWPVGHKPHVPRLEWSLPKRSEWQQVPNSLLALGSEAPRKTRKENDKGKTKAHEVRHPGKRMYIYVFTYLYIFIYVVITINEVMDKKEMKRAMRERPLLLTFQRLAFETPEESEETAEESEEEAVVEQHLEGGRHGDRAYVLSKKHRCPRGFADFHACLSEGVRSACRSSSDRVCLSGRVTELNKPMGLKGAIGSGGYTQPAFWDHV